MQSTRIGIVIGLLLCSSFVHAQSKDPLDQYWQDRSTWLEHLGEYIPVLELATGKAVGEQRRLSIRLESLQNKKVSNREWHEFWHEQAELATSLTAHLNALTPQVIEEKRRTMHAELRTLRTQNASPALVIAQKAAELRTEIRQLGQTNAALESQVSRVRTTLSKLASTATNLEAKPSSDAVAREKTLLNRSISETESKINRLSATYQANETRLLEKEQLLDVLTNDPTSVDSAILAEDETLSKAIATLKKSQGTAGGPKTAGTRIDQLTRDIQRLDVVRRNKVKERLFLSKWTVLARSKVKSQDAYLGAIDNQLSAVEERLKTFQTKKTKKDDDAEEEEPCRSSSTNKKSPFEQHRRCIAYLTENLEALKRLEEQTKLQQSMYETLSDTNLALIKVQRTDVDLVRAERDLAEQGRILLRGDTAWTEAWTDYSKRGAKKVEDLEGALRTSLKDKRELKAKTAVLSVAVERIAAQRVQLRARLEGVNGFGDTVLALGETALGIVQVGWPALVYFLIAFILIRMVRNYRDKKERESEQMDKGQTHEAIAELEHALAAAEHAEDEAKVMELHEEIGRLESLLKDQGQRMATIARVAAQAITLVIYIATALLMLDALTIDIGPILGGAAIFGLAISFGSQSLVKDVVSGFFILLENQYAVGDVVTINGQSGTVEKVTLRRTVLRSMRGEVHNLTNGSISSVTNMTQGWARVVMDIGVAYGTDIDHVKSVVNEVGNAMYLDDEWHDKLTEKPSFVGVTAFGESEITVRAWCKTKTFQNWGVERELNLRLKSAFEDANIEIPFPKRDINVVVKASTDVDGVLGDKSNSGA